jgi:hypothetical protein
VFWREYVQTQAAMCRALGNTIVAEDCWDLEQYGHGAAYAAIALEVLPRMCVSRGSWSVTAAGLAADIKKRATKMVDYNSSIYRQKAPVPLPQPPSAFIIKPADLDEECRGGDVLPIYRTEEDARLAKEYRAKLEGEAAEAAGSHGGGGDA